MEKNWHDLQNIIGYRFKDAEVLKQALSHSSYVNENSMTRSDCNERLEFLGDAVLELVSSEFLYKEYTEIPEGELTKLRASLVCEPALAFDARMIGLNEYLLLGKGEEQTGGRDRDSIISDACEALIGAIFIDGGFEEAKRFVIKFILNDIENKKLFYDSKTVLQEIAQRDFEAAPEYEIIKEYGPDHSKTFVAQVSLRGKVLGEGNGRTKKTAEQQASYNALIKLKYGR
jgi:ribonuclease-3